VTFDGDRTRRAVYHRLPSGVPDDNDPSGGALIRSAHGITGVRLHRSLTGRGRRGAVTRLKESLRLIADFEKPWRSAVGCLFDCCWRHRRSGTEGDR
jgi:hypothetical protein